MCDKENDLKISSYQIYYNRKNETASKMMTFIIIIKL